MPGLPLLEVPAARVLDRYSPPIVDLPLLNFYPPHSKAILPHPQPTIAYFTHVHTLIKGWTRILIKNVSMFPAARIMPEIINERPSSRARGSVLLVDRLLQ